ncbi:MAG: response regulator transcription factor [Kiritimatiellae bacterium]|nr:response regulator transcription factor [Kiritimatiellia bacterium]
MEREKSSAEPAPAGLLVIEDDPRVAGSLARGLREAGFEVRIAGRLAEASAAMAAAPPALLVLDLSLPDGDGLQWLRRCRREGHRQPVIILTARDAVADRVTGLEEGADDYLAKPFSFAELLARIRARLRSAAREAPADILRVADLEVDRRHREVRRAGRLVELTAREFDMLACLAQWAGHPVSRDMLARDVWKVNRRLTPLDNVIDVHLSHLREKIDRGREEKLIRTVRGVGFVLAGGAP